MRCWPTTPLVYPRSEGAFVLSNLPDEVAEQILNSRMPETHYMRLGKVLLLMAEQRKNANPVFKERIEKEQKKRGK